MARVSSVEVDVVEVVDVVDRCKKKYRHMVRALCSKLWVEVYDITDIVCHGCFV